MPITAGLSLEADPQTLEAAAEGLVRVNELMMHRAKARGRPLPPLYRSGVRYRREAPGVESWDTYDRLLRRGWGDCEDLAAARAAELRFTGGDKGARVAIRRVNRGLLHAVVRRSDGRIEDPSKRLGMSSRAPEAELGAAPGEIAYRIERTPNSWVVRVSQAGSGLPPAFAIARDAAMVPPGAPPPKTAAAKKKAKKRGKRGAWNFVKRVAKRGLKKAVPLALNAVVPGAGTAASMFL